MVWRCCRCRRVFYLSKIHTNMKGVMMKTVFLSFLVVLLFSGIAFSYPQNNGGLDFTGLCNDSKGNPLPAGTPVVFQLLSDGGVDNTNWDGRATKCVCSSNAESREIALWAQGEPNIGEWFLNGYVRSDSSVTLDVECVCDSFALPSMWNGTCTEKKRTQTSPLGH
jgi:hypothetical protein